jgi:hypothetical protein
MLTRPSSIGLSSPVGFAQSAFRTIRESGGRKYWLNGFANRGLFEGLAPESLPGFKATSLTGPTNGDSGLPYHDLIAWIRQRIQNAR